MVSPPDVVALEAAQLTDTVTHHGEGPGWDLETGRLCIVDLLAGDLVQVDPVTGTVTHRTHVDAVVAAWRPRTGGGKVVATERGFAVVDGRDRVERRVEAWTDATIRMNDGACDARGRFYCGSMAYDARTGAGTLWRLDPDWTVRPVLEDVTISNGLAWMPGSDAAYYVDTPTQQVDRVSFDDSGRLATRATHVAIDPAVGAPDGIAVDRDGGVWVALWGGSAVHRYDRDGALTHRVAVGAAQVSACAFGGPDLSTLFITTSAVDADAADSAAGAVFRVDTGVRGVPLHPFGG